MTDMHTQWLELVTTMLGWLPGLWWGALGLTAVLAAAVIWFFRTQLHLRTTRLTPLRAWGRLGLGVMFCLGGWALLFAWPWLNWHYPRLLFRFELPRTIGMVVTPVVLVLAALVWLYCAVALNNGSARFWALVLQHHKAFCMWVLGRANRSAYDLHMHWRWMVWGEAMKANWQSGHWRRLVLRQRWLMVLLSAAGSGWALHLTLNAVTGCSWSGVMTWVLFSLPDPSCDTLKSMKVAGAGGLTGAWSVFSAVLLAPIAFVLWWFRDTNQLWLIENNRKDTNLKDFQRLCEWATGTQLVEDQISTKTAPGPTETTRTFSEPPPSSARETRAPTRREGSEALQLAAVHQLKGYLMGEFGQQFQQPSFVLLLSLWSRLALPVIDANHPKQVLNGEEVNRKDYLAWQRRVREQIRKSPLAQAVLQSMLAHQGRALRLHAAHLPSAALAGLNTTIPGVDAIRLSHLKLSGIQLNLAHLSFAQLQGADLSWAELQGADLSWAHLQGADLREARLHGANLIGAQLQGADLREAHLQGADLRGAHIQGAVLKGAHLQGADLREAQLQGADLSRAQLQGADLTRAQLQGAWLINPVWVWHPNADFIGGKPNFWKANTDEQTKVEVRVDSGLFSSGFVLPHATHALRLKLKETHHLVLPEAAYAEYQLPWDALDDSQRDQMLNHAQGYAADPNLFRKTFPALWPS